MNKVIICGNLTRDMEVRKSNDLSIARGSIALDRGKDRDGNPRGADFPSLVAFGGTADFLGRFGKKGRRFVIEGRIQTGSYEKNGVKVYTTDIIIEKAEFADSKPATQEEAQTAEEMPEWMDVPDDMPELPFK